MHRGRVEGEGDMVGGVGCRACRLGDELRRRGKKIRCRSVWAYFRAFGGAYWKLRVSVLAPLEVRRWAWGEGRDWRCCCAESYF